MTFRSIDMAHFKLFLPRENYYHSLEQLLHLGNAHLVDIGNPLSRPYFQQVKRCDQLLLKIRMMTDTLKDKGIIFEQYNEMEATYMNDLQQLWKRQARQYGLEPSRLLDHFENEISDKYLKFTQKKNNMDKLKTNQKNILSKIACYQALTNFFGEAKGLGGFGMGGQAISTIVGVIDYSSELKLSRTVYRASRGYAFFKTIQQFTFQGSHEFNSKVVILIYPNSNTGVLQKKLGRIMQTFCTSVFQFREGDQTQAQMKEGRRQYEQCTSLWELNQSELNDLLQTVKSRHCIETWRTFLWKQKLIYESLNKMQLRDHFLVADIYIPKQEKRKLIDKISKIMPTPQFQELQVQRPPTAFDTNSYTIIAQQITNTYGVPRYEQINPAIFTTVTFPFFFGVMFGDIGHGLVLFLFGLYLVMNNESLKRGAFSFVCDLRYMVTMMGFFAFYCGWIYNDFIGMSLNIFGSCYTVLPDPGAGTYIGPKTPDCIYPIGLDPIWGSSANELVFINGLKMKVAVIIAILHMVVGVFIKLSNSLYFRRKLETVFEFIPQILFLGLLFGYMDFLIIYKWLKPWNCKIDPNTNMMDCNNGVQTLDYGPPSIISTMMDIGLKVGSTQKAGAMWGLSGGSSQDSIQVVILLIAVLCVPVMLLPKPIIQIKRLKKDKKDQHLLHEQLQNQIEKSQNILEQNSQASHDAQHDPGEIFVHQLIETIEFVLGAISNTASYLRLWALSLAHSQLAKVFFQKTLQSGFTNEKGYEGIIYMPIMFYILVWVTFGVLMCMDTMECFLHSLRLHWVQFQNKFYKGDGYRYEPISAKTYILHMKKESNS